MNTSRTVPQANAERLVRLRGTATAGSLRGGKVAVLGALERSVNVPSF